MSREFYARLAAIQENLNAPKNQHNSFGEYKYKGCENILEGVKPLLNGLFSPISGEVVSIGDRYYVKATATITDGENSHTVIALVREEESKKGMDSAQVTGAISSYARKYCLNGLSGTDDAKDADIDEHKHQQNATTKQSRLSFTPEWALKAFTDATMQKNTAEGLKQAFVEAREMFEGTPGQHKAQGVYNTRRGELEGVIT